MGDGSIHMRQLDRGWIKHFSVSAYMHLFITVAEIQGRKVSKWSKIWFKKNFFAHPVKTPWPMWLNARMCAGLCPTYWTAFGGAEKNESGSCPMHDWDHPPFFEFLTPTPPAPRDPMDPTGGGGTSADIVPTQIIFGVIRASVAEISLKNRQNAKIPHWPP